ncbi:MAG: DEAD/DEAH box helicase [Bacteroidota bacterium]
MISFRELELKEEILTAVDDLGFFHPTPIQEKAIPHVLDTKEDLIASAQTGTGKTAAFGLPVLNQIDTESRHVQSLILCPTRELCLQISKDLKTYAKYLEKVHIVAVYGGTSIDTQIKELNRGAQIVVGTPGRTLDLIKRKKLKVGHIRWMVLDEADEMLSMGFKEDLNAILGATPEEKQTLVFSATMPPDMVRMAKTYMNEPQEITASRQNLSSDNVSHAFYMVQAKDRYQALKRIIDVHPNVYGIIFCRTRRDTQEVADRLAQDGYNTDALHGDLSQAQRDHVMNRFRKKQIQLLIATDVAARGLDVNDLSHVINYHLPDDLDTYVHRSGRTGRADKKGVSIAIIHLREKRKIYFLEKRTGKKFEHRQIPQGRDICEKQLFNLIDKVERVEVEESEIEAFLPSVFSKLEWLSREELIKRFVSVEFNRFLAYYKDSEDINVRRNDRSSRQDRGRERGRGDRRDQAESFASLSINLGSKDFLSPKKLLGLINQHVPRNIRVQIGRIDVQRNLTFFAVDRSSAAILMKSMKEVNYKGKSVSVKPTTDKKKRKRKRKK